MRISRLLLTIIALATCDAALATTPPTTAELAGTDGFHQAYQAMLTLPSWVTTAHATSVPVSNFSADGKDYILGHMCRPHDCAAEQLEVVFAKDHSAAWGLLSIRNETSLRQNFLGAPDAAMQKILLKAYQDNNPSN
ncbi:Ivy family c-type lysozyme inhibitor [Gluconobacter roseus]|uniref:Ivy family c-type lysozyme inhibitor n=1 Tax=Gluconobacter roseus TaxID=586239 RepID=UPI0038D0F970